MNRKRRLLSLVVSFAIAWTALWPLVSSAFLVASGEAMPMCHQAGMQVDPSAPPEDGRGPHKEFKQHCPLCIMAFLAGTSMPVLEPAPPQLAGVAAREPHCAPIPAGIQTHFPLGRGPPALS